MNSVSQEIAFFDRNKNIITLINFLTYNAKYPAINECFSFVFCYYTWVYIFVNRNYYFVYGYGLYKCHRWLMLDQVDFFIRFFFHLFFCLEPSKANFRVIEFIVIINIRIFRYRFIKFLSFGKRHPPCLYQWYEISIFDLLFFLFVI